MKTEDVYQSGGCSGAGSSKCTSRNRFGWQALGFLYSGVYADWGTCGAYSASESRSSRESDSGHSEAHIPIIMFSFRPRSLPD